MTTPYKLEPIDDPEFTTELSVALVNITPELARKWLDDYNMHNRNHDDRRSESYRQDMIRGDWRINGDTITFGPVTTADGDFYPIALIDGQHRLGSIAGGTLTLPLVVMWGVEDLAQETVDSGRKRTLGDALLLRGYSDPNNLAAAVRMVYNYLLNFDLRKPRVSETNAQLIQSLYNHQGLNDSLIFARSHSVVGIPRSLIGAMHYLMGMVNVGDRDYFFDKLHEGTNLGKEDPIKVLRDWAVRQYTRSDVRSTPTHFIGALMIKAWNAFRRGRGLRAIGWRAGGTHPEDFPRMDGLFDALARGGPEPEPEMTDEAEDADTELADKTNAA